MMDEMLVALIEGVSCSMFGACAELTQTKGPRIRYSNPVCTVSPSLFTLESSVGSEHDCCQPHCVRASSLLACNVAVGQSYHIRRHNTHHPCPLVTPHPPHRIRKE